MTKSDRRLHAYQSHYQRFVEESLLQFLEDNRWSKRQLAIASSEAHSAVVAKLRGLIRRLPRE